MTKPFNCRCRLCRWAKGFRKLESKLSGHDRHQLQMMVGAVWDRMEEQAMEIAHLEDCNEQMKKTKKG